MLETYDAFLLLSFGGPEGPDEVIPFLENVLRGRDVPRERLIEVASHYDLFDGKSPINHENRMLLRALEEEFATRGPAIPVYWGNRNWYPFLAETLARMADDGVRNALAFVTSAYGSYSGCRQYREDIDAARKTVGPKAPEVDKLRLFYNHPGFVEANATGLKAALAEVPDISRDAAAVVFTAHSLPTSMASSSRYEAQVRAACGLVADVLGLRGWTLAFQSRSGPPGQPWLEPDINAHLVALRDEGVRDVVVAPIGFVSDHMEVVYDLDVEAQARARDLRLNLVRASSAGTHPAFISMVRELVLERIEGAPPRYLGQPPHPGECAPDCCPPPNRRRT
jgi:protoporphyrin/coproporphyrin ferrochelatase